MTIHHSLSRRQFVAAGASAISLSLPSIASGVSETLTKLKEQEAASDKAKPNAPQICVFTKPFNAFSFEQLAEAIAEIGFDGIEAPVRKGGHVDLKNVETDLTRLNVALNEKNLNMTLMATDINLVNAENEKLLKAAAKLGVKRYRLKYYRYQPKRSIKKQLTEWTAQLKDLAAMNQDIGITGLYQNHAGKNYFGAPIWDLAEVLDRVDSPGLGVAYDIRHATVEGGMSWQTTMRRIMPHVKMLYVKDFRWDEAGKLVNVPLGQGMIDKTFYQQAVKLGFSGPISLHEEYHDHRDPKLIPVHLKAMKRDLEVLKRWIKAAG